MLESLPVTLIIGTLLGFLSGLGVGGGSLLILWLTVILQIHIKPHFFPKGEISAITTPASAKAFLWLFLPTVAKISRRT